MENENIYRQEMLNKYRSAMGDLFRYIPWFEQKMGAKTMQTYAGNDSPSNSVPIPVYDSTLLGFVKEMQRTGLMDRNYVYVYSQYGIKNEQDELNLISQVEFKDIEVIFGIMAKYVLGGMTKGMLWSKAVENGVFLHGLKRIKELLEIWDQPLA
ncbi:MAG: hypothetical protein ACI4E5_04545 [Suilimivivens sp.]